MGFFARLRLAQNDKGEAVILRSAKGATKDLMALATPPACRTRETVLSEAKGPVLSEAKGPVLSEAKGLS